MKTIACLVAVTALSLGVAAAQDSSPRNNPIHPGQKVGASVDVNGFRSPNTLGPEGVNESSKFPNVHPDLRPRAGGVFVDGAKYGGQLINPSAPASYGMGEKYLTAPDPRYDLMHESGYAAHHDAGGIKLLTLEF